MEITARRIETIKDALRSTVTVLLRSSTTYTAIACLLFFLFTLYVLLPGGRSVDSAQQLEQAITGVYSDWHPPIMSWLWRQLNFIYFGHSSLVFFHCVLFWSGLLAFVLSITRSFVARVLCLLAVGFFPTNFVQLGMTWKDTGVSCSLMFATGAICLVTKLRSQGKGINVVVGLALLGMLYASAVRHNGIFAIIPLAYWLVASCAPYRSKFRTLATSCVLVVLLVLASKVINGRLATGLPGYPEQGIAFHDLLGISVRINKLIIPAEFLAKVPPLTLETLRPHYRPSEGSTMFWDNIYPHAPKDAPIEVLRQAWLQGILSYPMEYLAHRSQVYLALLNFTNSGWSPWAYDESYHDDPPFPGKAQTRTYFFSVLEYTDRSVIRKGWFYPLLCTILLCFITIYSPHHDTTLMIQCMSFSGLLYALGYFPITPSPDFRYLYWSILATTIAYVALFDAWRRHIYQKFKWITLGACAGSFFHRSNRS